MGKYIPLSLDITAPYIITCLITDFLYRYLCISYANYPLSLIGIIIIIYMWVELSSTVVSRYFSPIPFTPFPGFPGHTALADFPSPSGSQIFLLLYHWYAFCRQIFTKIFSSFSSRISLSLSAGRSYLLGHYNP